MMFKNNAVITILIFLNNTFATFLDQTEFTLLSDLLEEYQIKNVVLILKVGTYHSNLIHDIKKFSKHYTFSSYVNYYELVRCISETESNYSSNMIVFKEEKLSAVGKTLAELKAMTRIYHRIRQYKWLIFYLNNSDEFDQLSVRYDCELILVQRNHSLGYKLIEVYDTDNKHFTSELGTWNYLNRLKISAKYLYLRRQNLNETDLKILSPKAEVEDELRKSKPFLEILEDYSRIMNFRCHWMMRPNNDSEKIPFYTELDRHEYINGYLGPLLDSSYKDFYDQLGPIFKMKINWYIKYAETELRADYYLQPFNRNVWLAVIFIFLAGTVISIVIPKRYEKTSFIDALFLTFEQFCNQNGSHEKRLISSRILCLSLRITALTVLGSFGAVITSYLSVKFPLTPFRNLEEFFKNGKYRLASDKYLYSSYIMNILPQKEEYTVYYDVEEETKLTCLGRVYVDYDQSIYTKNLNCKIHQIEGSIGFVWAVAHMKRHNSFTKLFNYHFLRYYESGIRMRMESIVNYVPLEVHDKEHFKPVEFEQMIHVIAIPLLGLFLAIIIIIIEKAQNFRANKKKFIM